jgi:sterol desaturase/sphingolipid hydroxylase (fatty acid hydroxylase superfamily)
MIRRYQRSWQQIKCFAFFVPLFAILFITAGLMKRSFPFSYHLLLIFLGWLTATFIEYILHRFWMHSTKTKEPSALATYHQYHHTHPMEMKITFVMRISFVLLLVLLIYIATVLQNSFTLFVGLYVGFCNYALMHKAIHQAWAAKVFRQLVRYHIFHHCKFPNRCFGVSITWWDRIFKTTPPKTALISERVLHFYLHHEKGH